MALRIMVEHRGVTGGSSAPEPFQMWFDERDPFSPIAYRYPIKAELHRRRSPFQEIVVLETEFFGRMLVLDDVVQLTERDEFLYHEMLAHVPLHLLQRPERVLIVGGGDGGTLREVLKHPTIQRVTVVELDREVIEVAKEYFPGLARSFSSPKVTVHHADGVEFLRAAGEQFDAILVDSTDPVGPAKALSTPSFFASAKQRLTAQGLFAMQTESLHFHVQHVDAVQAALRGVFPAVSLYAAPIATYAGNWWTFSLACRRENDWEPVRSPVDGTRVYGDALHRGAFVPAEVRSCFSAIAADWDRRETDGASPP